MIFAIYSAELSDNLLYTREELLSVSVYTAVWGRMKVVKRLYVGESAKKDKRKILRGLEKKELQPFVYVITLPLSEHGVLDIIPAYTLKYPFFFTGDGKDLRIVGIARGRYEAIDLTVQIVMDTYSATGGFDVRGFLN